jgi:predicted N-acetyltransferase YhbS
MTEKKVYNHSRDYEKVNQLLYDSFVIDKYINWIQPRWEYMHYHPILNTDDYKLFATWFDDDELVAVVHHEHRVGQAFLQVKDGYDHLKEEMVIHAENSLVGEKEGKKYLDFYCKEFDNVTIELLKQRGYQKIKDDSPWLIVTKINPNEIGEVKLDSKFELIGLDEENDLVKIDRVLWRGFNHEGESDGDLDGRKQMQSPPNFNKYLNVVIMEKSSGNYVSYSGSWYDPVNKVGYIEPVATDPDFRKMGLGKVAVLECVKRLGKLGAKAVYVESGIPFYQRIGFKPVFKYEVWHKEF